MGEQGEGKSYAILYTWNKDGKPGLIMTRTRQPVQEIIDEQLEDDKKHGRTTLNYVVEIPPAVELTREYIATKLHLWNLARRLEEDLGEDLDNLGDVTDFICSGLDDDAPNYQAVNALFSILDQIKKDHGLEGIDIKDYTTEVTNGKGT